MYWEAITISVAIGKKFMIPVLAKAVLELEDQKVGEICQESKGQTSSAQLISAVVRVL